LVDCGLLRFYATEILSLDYLNLFSAALSVEDKILYKGKYFGQKPPPPGGWNKFTLPKNREEIQLWVEKPKNFPAFTYSSYSSLFLSFLDDLTTL